jgi:BirA family biotin operon repressor/biotin-[acetyl-CoA-carboxylase] ligase
VTEIRRYETLDSTNDEARRLALAGEHGPLWVVASRQTAGRGRRGRSWVSEPGNLFCTLLVELDASLGLCGQLSFAASLAVADVVVGFTPNNGVTLKWPNDVLLEGKKTAGVLLEAAPNGEGSRLLVGIGINLSSHPDAVEYPATSLRAVVDPPPSPEEAHTRLVAAWDAWYEKWRAYGFAPLREAWQARAEGVGKRVKARLGTSEVEGLFEDLEQDGAMLLRLDNGGMLRLTTGEIYFGS